MHQNFHTLPGCFTFAREIILDLGSAVDKNPDQTGLIDLIEEEKDRVVQADSNARTEVEPHKSDTQTAHLQRLTHYFTNVAAVQGEGLMVKTMSSKYECGVRSAAWMKCKKDYLGATGGGGGTACDSLDLVPIGGKSK